MGRYSKFAKAAFILVLAFFVLCACTIGGFDTPGKAMRITPDDEVVFYLKYNGSSKGDYLGQIYLNIGSVYTDAGQNAQITFNYASVPGSSSSSINWSSSNRIGSRTVGNVYSADGEGVSGANYNWLKFRDLTVREGNRDPNPLETNYKLIRLTVDTEMLINEVIFVDVDGDRIPAYVTREGAKSAASSWNSLLDDAFRHNENYTPDVVNLLDAQDSLRYGETTYTNFTQDEAYSLMQIDNVFLGGEVYEKSSYPIDADSGSLATLFLMLGTLVFGKSLFGLRIVPVIFTAALVAVAYLFAKRLFKSDGFGFLFACLFAGGGIALTAGRLGLAIPLFAFFTVLSYYLMYRFYEQGISSEKPVKSALNVLISGLSFAFAFAIDAKAVIAAIGIVVLFVLGAVRQHRAHAAAARAVRKEMSDKNAVETSEERMQANIDACEEREAALFSEYAYKNRLIYLFFIVAFVVGTLLVTVLSALPSYFSYVKFYEADPENPALGLFALIGRHLKDNFTVGNLTEFTAANASNAFGWLIALKGATLWSASEGSTYIAMNAQMNPVLMLVSLIGLLFMTTYAVLYFVTGGKKGPYATEHSGRILNAYLVMALGLLSSLLAFAFAGDTGAASGMLFNVFYIGFIPLAFYTAFVHDKSGSDPAGGKNAVAAVKLNTTMKVLIIVCAVAAAVFVLTLAMQFCIPLNATAAKYCFGWTTFVNNGYYRI